MRVRDGENESSKNKLHGLVMWTKIGRWQTGEESRCPESGKEMMARKSEIAMRDYVKSDLEKIGEEWKRIETEGIGDCWKRTW